MSKHGVYSEVSFPEEPEQLAELLNLVIDQYERDRTAYWTINNRPFWGDRAEPLLFPTVDDLADAVQYMAENLHAPYSTGRPDPWQLAAALGFTATYGERILERLQILYAKSFAEGLNDIVGRCQSLSLNILRGVQSENVKRYLTRVSRAFIAGLFPETVILCRSALEAASRAAFELRGIPAPASDGQRSEMKARLEAAKNAGWLNTTQFAMAWTLWQRGNAAVHNDPTLVDEYTATSTVRETVDILSALLPQ